MAKYKSTSRKQSRLQARRVAAKRKTKAIQIGIAIAVLSTLSFILYNNISKPKPVPVSQVRLLDNPRLGSENAVVTLVEFADFGCPSCKAWHEAGIFDDLLAEFGDKLAIEWRDYPIITLRSPKAAEAGQCAYDQGMFWEFHDVAFDNAPNFATNALKSYAEQIGLNMQEFNACLDSDQHKETVNFDWEEASSLRLPGTPSFLINGQPVIGPNPTLIRDFIVAAIEAAE